MKKDLLHTPEGVRDIYSTECVEKKITLYKVHKKEKNILADITYCEKRLQRNIIKTTFIKHLYKR